MLLKDIDPRTATRLAPWAATASLAVAMLMTAPAALAADATPGLRVVKDPVTGQLRAPTAEEAAALESVTTPARSNARAASRGMVTGRVNPQSIQHPDGTVQQELDESTMSYSVATRAPNGSVKTYCVTGSDAATAIVKSKKGATKIAKEHGREDK